MSNISTTNQLMSVIDKYKEEMSDQEYLTSCNNIMALRKGAPESQEFYLISYTTMATIVRGLETTVVFKEKQEYVSFCSEMFEEIDTRIRIMGFYTGECHRVNQFLTYPCVYDDENELSVECGVNTTATKRIWKIEKK